MSDENRFNEDENEDDFNFEDYSPYNEEEDSDLDDVDIDPLETDIRSAIPLELITRWKDTEFNLKINEINLAILRTSIKVASESFLWRFRPLSSRVKKIISTYYTLNNLIDNNSSIYTDAD